MVYINKMKNYDKYYTNNYIVKKCCSIFKKNIKISKKDIIIEPSAGNGAFLQCINKYNHILLDINPDNSNIIKQNYLKYNYTELVKKYNKIYIIGNPPFGKKSSMAIKFIKKSCEFCDSFGFILPRSFNKVFLQKSIPLNYHLITSYNLPDNAFELPIKCVFQIWSKKNYKRKKIKKILPNSNYVFISNKKKADIAIRRVGFYSGKVYNNSINNKNINTHYFIKFRKGYKSHIINDLKLKKESNNTLCANSISKRDIIKKLNKIFK